ncbi:bactofilin family protein [Hellea balneolensis]|uniref:bactofilin family protein n=1 Tax=Hellea balneolensis TaxID=287478 RepID=UPI0003F9D25F|nr:polymer-forming cytoskeletal protein [Hellea balneolensis]
MFNKTNSSSSSAPSAPDMPAKKTSSPSRGAAVPSIFGSDIVITGDIKTDGHIQIDGRLDGNIQAGNVTIGEKGAVNGKIVAGAVHIRGKVTGKIEANVVDLSETANVQADLVQDQLMIANGAFFDGKCTRKSNISSAAKTAKKTA